MNISAASFSLSIANFRAQTLNSLVNSGSDAGSSFGDILSGAASGASTGNVSLSGRNLALNDPESAYAMMTEINRRDATYKAQYSELSQMKSYLPQVQGAAEQLGKLTASDSNDSIKTGLQDFAQQYNAWVDRFGPDVQSGGVLDGTQAAEVSVYELDQSVKNVFVGAKDGFHGLADMGITIDPNTHKMSIDAAKLDATLASNKQAVVDALDDFSANFAKAASLLGSDGNFIRHQLDNLHGAIGYIDANVASWQKEFGSGDAAAPTGQVAQALAAYNQAFSM